MNVVCGDNQEKKFRYLNKTNIKKNIYLNVSSEHFRRLIWQETFPI